MNQFRSVVQTRDDVATQQENENVEMFFLHKSLKPVILQPSPAVSNGKRRFRLLKNVARAARRRSSLKTRKGKNSSKTYPDNEEKRDEPVPSTFASSRHSSISISSKRSSSIRRVSISSTCSLLLSDNEQFFLDKLINSDDVWLEDLENCCKVLSKEPLYQQESTKVVAEENAPPKQESSESDEARNSSFRKETWKHYMATSWTSDQGLMKPEQGDKEEQANESTRPNQKPSWMDKFFTISIESSDERIAEPQDAEETYLPPCIIGTSADDSECNPHVLSPPIMDVLRSHLPYAIQGHNFWLQYSMIRDGASMNTLLHKVRNSARTIIAIETMNGDVFGSFTSSPWHPHGRGYYGSCEAFMWRLKKFRLSSCETVEEQIRLESKVEVFPWTMQNRNIQRSVNTESPLWLGGGGPDDDPFAERDDWQSALILEPCLTRGTSNKCLTFNSPSLPTMGEDTFEIANIEVWTMTPVDNLDQAEKLEMCRQFLFEHGTFPGQE